MAAHNFDGVVSKARQRRILLTFERLRQARMADQPNTDHVTRGKGKVKERGEIMLIHALV
jgi:hypothetical protein